MEDQDHVITNDAFEQQFGSQSDQPVDDESVDIVLGAAPAALEALRRALLRQILIPDRGKPQDFPAGLGSDIQAYVEARRNQVAIKTVAGRTLQIQWMWAAWAKAARRAARKARMEKVTARAGRSQESESVSQNQQGRCWLALAGRKPT